MKDRIKQLRLSQGLTQAEFASALGVSRNTVAIWETVDERAPSAITLNLMCDKYGVNLQWLKTGDGEMFRSLKQDEKLAEMMKAIDATDESSDGERFRRAVVMALARITPEQWEKIAKEANRLLDDFKT